MVMSAWMYCWVERVSACPSQRAMTVLSTRACSSDIAQLCRSACGCTHLCASDGQRCAAVAAWVATRRSTASRVRRRPVLAAFAFDADVRSGPELEVGAVDRDQLGDPQAGVDREREQRAVAPSLP